MTNELAFQSCEAALEVAKLLLKENYVVMLSNEEDLTILNYEWSEYGDRNDVVFMSLEEYTNNVAEMCEEIEKECDCNGCKD